MKPIVREKNIKTLIAQFRVLEPLRTVWFTHLRSYFLSLELISKYIKNQEHPPQKMVCSQIIQKVLNSSPSQLNVFGGEKKSKQ